MAGWSLTESAGPPVAAYALAAWADGRGPDPLVARLAAEVVSLRQPAGTGASALWFLAVLRKVGLRLRFAPARA